MGFQSIDIGILPPLFLKMSLLVTHSQFLDSVVTPLVTHRQGGYIPSKQFIKEVTYGQGGYAPSRQFGKEVTYRQGSSWMHGSAPYPAALARRLRTVKKVTHRQGSSWMHGSAPYPAAQSRHWRGQCQ